MKLKLLVLLKNVKTWASKYINVNAIAEAEERFHFGKVYKEDESNKK